MNHSNVGSAQGRPAIASIGSGLQVDESLAVLRASVERHANLVDTLLRRLEPVTGQMLYGSGDSCATVEKVPLALSLDAERDRINTLTAAVESAIAALQI